MYSQQQQQQQFQPYTKHGNFFAPNPQRVTQQQHQPRNQPEQQGIVRVLSSSQIRPPSNPPQQSSQATNSSQKRPNMKEQHPQNTSHQSNDAGINSAFILGYDVAIDSSDIHRFVEHEEETPYENEESNRYEMHQDGDFEQNEEVALGYSQSVPSLSSTKNNPSSQKTNNYPLQNSLNMPQTRQFENGNTHNSSNRNSNNNNNNSRLNGSTTLTFPENLFPKQIIEFLQPNAQTANDRVGTSIALGTCEKILAERYERSEESQYEKEFEQGLKFLNQVAVSCLNQNQLDKCLQILQKCKQLTEVKFSVINSPIRALTLNNFGCYFRRQMNLPKALQFLEMAERFLVTTKQNRYAGITHLNISAVLSQIGEHYSSLDHANKAVEKTYEEYQAYLKNTDFEDAVILPEFQEIAQALAIAFYNVGVEQEYFENYDMCLVNYRKACDVAAENLGRSHQLTKRFSALLVSFTDNLNKKQKSNSKKSRLGTAHNSRPSSARRVISQRPNSSNSKSSNNNSFNSSKYSDAEQSIIARSQPFSQSYGVKPSDFTQIGNTVYFKQPGYSQPPQRQHNLQPGLNKSAQTSQKSFGYTYLQSQNEPSQRPNSALYHRQAQQQPPSQALLSQTMQGFSNGNGSGVRSQLGVNRSRQGGIGGGMYQSITKKYGGIGASSHAPIRPSSASAQGSRMPVIAVTQSQPTNEAQMESQEQNMMSKTAPPLASQMGPYRRVRPVKATSAVPAKPVEPVESSASKNNQDKQKQDIEEDIYDWDDESPVSESSKEQKNQAGNVAAISNGIVPQDEPVEKVKQNQAAFLKAIESEAAAIVAKLKLEEEQVKERLRILREKEEEQAAIAKQAQLEKQREEEIERNRREKAHREEMERIEKVQEAERAELEKIKSAKKQYEEEQREREQELEKIKEQQREQKAQFEAFLEFQNNQRQQILEQQQKEKAALEELRQQQEEISRLSEQKFAEAKQAEERAAEAKAAEARVKEARAAEEKAAEEVRAAEARAAEEKAAEERAVEVERIRQIELEQQREADLRQKEKEEQEAREKREAEEVAEKTRMIQLAYRRDQAKKNTKQQALSKRVPILSRMLAYEEYSLYLSTFKQAESATQAEEFGLKSTQAEFIIQVESLNPKKDGVTRIFDTQTCSEAQLQSINSSPNPFTEGLIIILRDTGKFQLKQQKPVVEEVIVSQSLAGVQIQDTETGRGESPEEDLEEEYKDDANEFEDEEEGDQKEVVESTVTPTQFSAQEKQAAMKIEKAVMAKNSRRQNASKQQSKEKNQNKQVLLKVFIEALEPKQTMLFTLIREKLQNKRIQDVVSFENLKRKPDRWFAKTVVPSHLSKEIMAKKSHVTFEPLDYFTLLQDEKRIIHTELSRASSASFIQRFYGSYYKELFFKVEKVEGEKMIFALQKLVKHTRSTENKTQKSEVSQKAYRLRVENIKDNKINQVVDLHIYVAKYIANLQSKKKLVFQDLFNVNQSTAETKIKEIVQKNIVVAVLRSLIKVRVNMRYLRLNVLTLDFGRRIQGQSSLHFQENQIEQNTKFLSFIRRRITNTYYICLDSLTKSPQQNPRKLIPTKFAQLKGYEYRALLEIARFDPTFNYQNYLKVTGERSMELRAEIRSEMKMDLARQFLARKLVFVRLLKMARQEVKMLSTSLITYSNSIIAVFLLKYIKKGFCEVRYEILKSWKGDKPLVARLRIDEDLAMHVANVAQQPENKLDKYKFFLTRFFYFNRISMQIKLTDFSLPPSVPQIEDAIHSSANQEYVSQPEAAVVVEEEVEQLVEENKNAQVTVPELEQVMSAPILFIVNDQQVIELISVFFNRETSQLIFKALDKPEWTEYKVHVEGNENGSDTLKLGDLKSKAQRLLKRLKVNCSLEIVEISPEEEQATSLIQKQLNREEVICTQAFALRLNFPESEPRIVSGECRFTRKLDTYFVHLYENNLEQGAKSQILRETAPIGKLTREVKQNIIKNFSLLSTSNITVKGEHIAFDNVKVFSQANLVRNN